jgi:hypothetical protein
LAYYTPRASQRLFPLILVSGFNPRKATLAIATFSPAQCGAFHFQWPKRAMVALATWCPSGTLALFGSPPRARRVRAIQNCRFKIQEAKDPGAPAGVPVPPPPPCWSPDTSPHRLSAGLGDNVNLFAVHGRRLTERTLPPSGEGNGNFSPYPSSDLVPRPPSPLGEGKATYELPCPGPLVGPPRARRVRAIQNGRFKIQEAKDPGVQAGELGSPRPPVEGNGPS